MKFDFVIGNPPYQQDVKNEGDRANPVYDKFMDSAFQVGDYVELIHPARFLFNAGQTSKQWNMKMLQDTHYKILKYEPDATVIFPNTDIKGGVAISVRNANLVYGAIGTFTTYSELNAILKKIAKATPDDCFIDNIVSSRGLYRFSPAFYETFPDASSLVGTGSGNMIVSNAFDKLSQVFLPQMPNDGKEYISILGRTGNSRVVKYIVKSFVIDNEFLHKFNVMMPEANGTGKFGETLSSPFVAKPEEGATDTFISIGKFDSEKEADALLNFIKTKFARALLGVNKATQHNPKSVWKSIPQQDFTPSSDIDWSKPIRQIDQQLYHKYGLTEEEITFIETHVKEMN